MPTLTALLLADERPGHFHLSDGIIAAARRIRQVEVIRMRIRRRWSGRLLALLSNAHFPADWLLRSAYGISPSTLPRVDFIVSAGAETLAASIFIARLTGAPNIYYGSLRRYSPEGVRLVLTSYASQCHLPHHVMVLKPSALTRNRPGSAQRLKPGITPECLGLLIGGDSGECRFDVADWQHLLSLMGQCHKTYGIRWVVSNSRRTPSEVSDSLANLTRSGSGPISDFIDVRVEGSGTLGRLLEQVQAVVCTDDSSSMISECISAGFAVVGARPRRAVFHPDERGYRKYLFDNGWYRSIAIRDLSPDTLLAELRLIKPMTEDPLDRLASILRNQLPELFAA